MILKPVEAIDIEPVNAWMADEENYKWLDFGHDVQRLMPVSLKVMMQRDIHCIRLFTDDVEDRPIGLAGLSDISRLFKTANLWYVLGNKQYGGQGYTSRGVSMLLTFGFKELGLEAIHAWAVESNIPSIRVLEHNHFSMIGRQRHCHYVDGRAYDRLLFDLLASEHTG